jgi:hypothetical protein
LDASCDAGATVMAVEFAIVMMLPTLFSMKITLLMAMAHLKMMLKFARY